MAMVLLLSLHYLIVFCFSVKRRSTVDLFALLLLLISKWCVWFSSRRRTIVIWVLFLFFIFISLLFVTGMFFFMESCCGFCSYKWFVEGRSFFRGIKSIVIVLNIVILKVHLGSSVISCLRSCDGFMHRTPFGLGSCAGLTESCFLWDGKF